MIRINLLVPHKVRKEKDNRWLIKGTILGYTLFLLAALLGYWWMSDQIQNLKKEKENLELKTRTNASLQKEIRELMAKKTLSQARLNLLQNLDQDRQSPVQLMDFLSTSLPFKKLWLIALKENGPEIRLEGMALTNDILAEFIKRLESLPLFKQVDLIHSTQVNHKNLKVKQFTLIAWTKAPHPASPMEKK